MHIYDACMQMAVWDVGLQWAQMFKNLWPKLSVQNRQGGAAANKHAGKLWCWKLVKPTCCTIPTKLGTVGPKYYFHSQAFNSQRLWSLCAAPPQISFSQMSSPPALLQDNGNYSFFYNSHRNFWKVKLWVDFQSNIIWPRFRRISVQSSRSLFHYTALLSQSNPLDQLLYCWNCLLKLPSRWSIEL